MAYGYNKRYGSPRKKVIRKRNATIIVIRKKSGYRRRY